MVIAANGRKIIRSKDEVIDKFSNMKRAAVSGKPLPKSEPNTIDFTQHILDIVNGTKFVIDAWSSEESDVHEDNITTCTNLKNNESVIEKRRKRKANYSEKEVSVLLKEVAKYYDILGSSDLSVKMSLLRKRCWQIIADKVSSDEVNTCPKTKAKRGWEEVREKFSTLKRLAIRNSHNGTMIKRGNDLEGNNLQIVLNIINSLNSDSASKERSETFDLQKSEHNSNVSSNCQHDFSSSTEDQINMADKKLYWKTTVDKLKDSLLQTCCQLKSLGVEAEVAIFDRDSVQIYGHRLACLVSHPDFTKILLDSGTSKEYPMCKPQCSDCWHHIPLTKNSSTVTAASSPPETESVTSDVMKQGSIGPSSKSSEKRPAEKPPNTVLEKAVTNHTVLEKAVTNHTVVEKAVTNLIKLVPGQGEDCSRELELLKTIMEVTAPKQKERNYTCLECGKKFFTKASLVVHNRIHTGEKPFKCDFKSCEAAFNQRSSFILHKRRHEGLRPHQCGFCSMRFYTSGDLISHVKRLHEVDRDTEKVLCTLCGKGYANKRSLKTHMRSHLGLRPFQCSICKKFFCAKSTRDKHMLIHTGVKPFQCEVCGAKFSEKCNMQTHMRIHTGIKQFKCEFCNEAFYVSSALKVHRRKHTGERPYLCHDCGASFITGSLLHIHQRTHTGAMPYKCDECGQSFKDRYQLTVHTREHTGIQPYTCSTCGKALRCASKLKAHMRSHTGEKPYGCDLCCERFSRRDVLTHHKKSKHISPPVKICDNYKQALESEAWHDKHCD